MIIEAIFNLIFDLIFFVLGLIPNFDNIFSFMTERFEVVAFIDLINRSRFIMPWGTVFLCVGIMITFYNAQFLMSIINWILRRIPTQS